MVGMVGAARPGDLTGQTRDGVRPTRHQSTQQCHHAYHTDARALTMALARMAVSLLTSWQAHHPDGDPNDILAQMAEPIDPNGN